MSSYSVNLPTELKRLQLRSRRLVTGDLLGQYRSAFRGTGLLYSDLREYQPGDDVKHIHWKATARAGKAFVKSYEEDRQLRVMLAVDVSSSMRAGVGTGAFTKALEFCSLIGALTQHGNDLLGLHLFSDSPGLLLPPKSGPKRFSRILSALLTEPPHCTTTDLNQALQHLFLTTRKTSIVFVLSDFMCPDFSATLGKLCARHDVILVQTQPSETAIPSAGLVTFQDAESGEIVAVDTSNRSVVAAWKQALTRSRESVRQIAQDHGATHLVIQDHAATPLVQLMRERVKKVSR